MAEPARRTGWTTTRVLLLALVMGVLTALLVWRATSVAAQASLPVEAYVELVTLGIGALVAAWLALSSGLALACLLIRTAGRSWGHGERLVTRYAPAVVRRAARLGVTVSVGAGLVLGGGTAYAADVEAPEAPAGVAVAVDLGWHATDTEVAHDAPQGDTAAPQGDTADEPQDGAPTGSPSGTSTTNAATPEAGSDPTDVPDATATPPAAADPTPAPSSAHAAAEAPGSTPGSTAGAAGQSGSTTRVAPVSTTSRDSVLTVRRTTSSPPSTPRATPDDDDDVVVVRGDTLWSIASRTLPDDVTTAEVAASVERWHAANRGVIGDDPNLILPGQILSRPSA